MLDRLKYLIGLTVLLILGNRSYKKELKQRKKNKP
jgi:hypothetical protein